LELPSPYILAQKMLCILKIPHSHTHPSPMQYFTLIGGFVGFLLTFVVSFLAGKDLADSVFNATIGCVLVAFLFRAFRYAAENCAKQIVAQKKRQRDEELAAQQTASAESADAPPVSEAEPKPAS
jgi:high-affinity K+ transport system ATPase subunit B